MYKKFGGYRVDGLVGGDRDKKLRTF
jgi:hypothetical protein